jgi:protein ImuA
MLGTPSLRVLDLPSGEPPEGGDLPALRQAIQALEGAAPLGEAGVIPFGITALDAVLGGGLIYGALHEIAVPREPDIAAASGFALALAAHASRKAALWIAEDMALLESGAPHGPGLDALGLAPERLVTVAAAKSREVLWAMEEALRCRAVGVVIAEVRGDHAVDLVATRRLSLAATSSGALALLLRSTQPSHASAAATRWIVGPAPSPAPHGPGPPRFAVELKRNRRGPLGAWMLEYRREQHFRLASAHPEPLAQKTLDRPHRAGSACSGEVDAGSPSRTCANQQFQSLSLFQRNGTGSRVA